MVFFDPRKEDSAIKGASHQGPRAQKLAWVNEETCVTTGFGKTAEREFGLWDLRKLDAPLQKGALGEGTGTAHVHFD